MPLITADSPSGRISIKLLKPDIASALIWSLLTFPDSKKELVQSTMAILRKFNGDWKIIDAHSNSSER